MSASLNSLLWLASSVAVAEVKRLGGRHPSAKPPAPRAKPRPSPAALKCCSPVGLGGFRGRGRTAEARLTIRVALWPVSARRRIWQRAGCAASS